VGYTPHGRVSVVLIQARKDQSENIFSLRDGNRGFSEFAAHIIRSSAYAHRLRWLRHRPNCCQSSLPNVKRKDIHRISSLRSKFLFPMFCSAGDIEPRLQMRSVVNSAVRAMKIPALQALPHALKGLCGSRALLNRMSHESPSLPGNNMLPWNVQEFERATPIKPSLLRSERAKPW